MLKSAVDRKMNAMPYWRIALEKVSQSRPDIVTPRRKGLLHAFLNNIEDIYMEIKKQPQTFVHYDPHPGKKSSVTK